MGVASNRFGRLFRLGGWVVCDGGVGFGPCVLTVVLRGSVILVFAFIFITNISSLVL